MKPSTSALALRPATRLPKDVRVSSFFGYGRESILRPSNDSGTTQINNHFSSQPPCRVWPRFPPYRLKGGTSVHYRPDWRRSMPPGRDARQRSAGIAMTNGLDIGVLLVELGAAHPPRQQGGDGDAPGGGRPRRRAGPPRLRRPRRPPPAAPARRHGGRSRRPGRQRRRPAPVGGAPLPADRHAVARRARLARHPARLRARPRHRRRALPPGLGRAPVRALPAHGRRGAHGAGPARRRAAAGRGRAPRASACPTVRTTLQRVFNKTDTHRQPELVWLLLAQGAAEDDAAAPSHPVSPDRPRRPAVGPRCAPPLPGGAGRSTCAPTAVSRRR